ncbi:MAG TPA: hypothetical protein VHY08_02635 [Bacillota bacterium]|nr:hypothetical protein [Bacillota bacterium]
MTTQRLVSGTLTSETKTEILEALNLVSSKLDFLIPLGPDEIKFLYKAGPKLFPLIEKSYQFVRQHPELLPEVFDAAEFKRKYQLWKDLVPIINLVKGLADGLENTDMAIKSDLLADVTYIYGAIKRARDMVPGLDVVAEEMAQFFPRTGKKARSTGKAIE